jgi:hypothetical protein
LTGDRRHAPHRRLDVPPLYNLPGSDRPPARLRLVERPKVSAAALATSTAAKAAAAAAWGRTSLLSSSALSVPQPSHSGGTNIGKLDASPDASWGGSSSRGRRSPSPTNRHIGATLSASAAAAERAAAAVPAGVVTGADAVRHFVSGAGRKGEALFCNVAAAAAEDDADVEPRHHTQDSRGGAAAGLGEDGTLTRSSCPNVYDLVVVPQRRADAELHFVVSYGGVVEMRWV